MMRRAGVSLRVVEHSEYHEKYDQISHDWIRYLTRHSVVPILIPNICPVEDFFGAVKLDFVLLSNGNNVGDIGVRAEDNCIPDVSLERDWTERKLVEYALKKDIPILGVCRGMQMLNVYFDGSLERNLSGLYSREKPHVCRQHPIQVTHDGVAEMLSADILYTNSYHDQGVSVRSMGRSLRHFAMADDMIVEGFFHPDYHVLGIQWHPEREHSDKELDELVVRAWQDREYYESLFLAPR